MAMHLIRMRGLQLVHLSKPIWAVWLSIVHESDHPLLHCRSHAEHLTTFCEHRFNISVAGEKHVQLLEKQSLRRSHLVMITLVI